MPKNQTRILPFTEEEKELIDKAIKVIPGMKIYKNIFFHDAIIEKAKRMLEGVNYGNN